MNGLLACLSAVEFDRRYYKLCERTPQGEWTDPSADAVDVWLRAQGLEAQLFRMEKFYRVEETKYGVKSWLHLSFRRGSVEVGLHWHTDKGVVGGPAHKLARDVARSRVGDQEAAERERRFRKTGRGWPRVPMGSLSDCPIEEIASLFDSASVAVAALDASNVD